MRLIYISNVNEVLEGKISIIDSQVIELLNFYSKNNLFEEIILLAGKNKDKIPNDNLKNVLADKINIIYFDTFPDYPLLNIKTKKSVFRALSKIEKLSEFIIHTRLETFAIYAHKTLLKLHVPTDKIIADIRGVAYTEIKEYSSKNFLVKNIKLFTKKRQLSYLSKISNISTVSEALKNYLITQAKVDSNKIKVVPCIAGSNFTFNPEDRKSKRQELKIQDSDFMIIHVTGGDSDWQNTKEVVHFFSNFNIKLLNLSKKKFDIPNVINKFIPYSEVPKYLSASDAAIIWRNKSTTNFVSSPVKFSEYACNGLPVISNQNIDSITHYIQDENAGIILEELTEFNESLIATLKLMNREKLSAVGKSNFGVEIIAEKYINYYSNLIH